MIIFNFIIISGFFLLLLAMVCAVKTLLTPQPKPIEMGICSYCETPVLSNQPKSYDSKRKLTHFWCHVYTEVCKRVKKK